MSDDSRRDELARVVRESIAGLSIEQLNGDFSIVVADAIRAFIATNPGAVDRCPHSIRRSLCPTCSSTMTNPGAEMFEAAQERIRVKADRRSNPGAETMAALADKLTGNAIRIRQCLADPRWQPSRSHVEAARNTLEEVAEALRSAPALAEVREAKSALTKIAAECHRAKWQFDFSDENRLAVGRARDMVKRAFGEIHRIGDMALKLRDAPPIPRPERGIP